MKLAVERKVLNEVEGNLRGRLDEYTRRLASLKEDNRSLLIENERLKREAELARSDSMNRINNVTRDWERFMEAVLKQEEVRKDDIFNNERRIKELQIADMKN